MVPENRHILVELSPEESQSSVLVPDDYAAVKQYEVATILKSARNCEKVWHPQDRVVVPGNMLVSFKVGNKEHHLIQENYVLATLSWEDDKDV